MVWLPVSMRCFFVLTAGGELLPARRRLLALLLRECQAKEKPRPGVDRGFQSQPAWGQGVGNRLTLVAGLEILQRVQVISWEFGVEAADTPLDHVGLIS